MQSNVSRRVQHYVTTQAGLSVALRRLMQCLGLFLWFGFCVMVVSPPAAHATEKKSAEKKAADKKTAEKKKESTQTKRTNKAAKTNKPAVTEEPAVSPEALNAQREALQERLRALKKEIAKSESNRVEARDALAKTEQAISETNRRLRELAQQQRATAQRLEVLGSEQKIKQNDLQALQTRIAEFMRQRYMQGSADAARLFFSGENPNRIGRDLHYLSYISQAQTEIVQQYQGTLRKLDELKQETSAKHEALVENRKAQETEKETLQQQSSERKQTLEKISSQLTAQRKEAGALERDEKRLGQLVEKITRLLAERKREQERARAKEEARRKKEASGEEKPDKRQARNNKSEPSDDKGSKSASVGRNETLPDDDLPKGAFAQLKGRLRLPVRGEVISRFGNPRSDGGPSWKGVFIRAGSGSEIKAVAAGRVVFAEWLRGFGNLLIIDHGDQYLTIYGNNEALFKRVNDKVKAGDAVASVGNSGGNPETGLYFELRQNGQPVDPLKWAPLR